MLRLSFMACTPALTISCAGVRSPAETARQPAIAWQPWSPESFARARRERRLIVLHGAARWCHWCDLMDRTTYGDPAVRRVVSERFLAIRIDVTERPDLAERYGDGGWPATIVLSPDAVELGQVRGYLPPAMMVQVLEAAERVSDREEAGAR